MNFQTVGGAGRWPLSFGVTAAAVMGLRAVAAEAPPAGTNAVFTLGKTVIYGQAETPADQLPDRVDAARLERFERKDLAAGLNLLPGIHLNEVGQRNEAGVYVRGFDLRQVPLFVDGIPVYVPYDGYVDLSRFTTYDTGEISVSKGYSSVLYGPNSLGGAINVVSRQPVRPFEADARVGWFSGGGREFAANAGGKQQKWYFQAGASYLEQDYFPLSEDFKPIKNEDGGHRENSYRRDWRTSAKVAYTPNDTDEYALGYTLQQGEKGNPPYAGTDPLQPTRFWRWPEWNKWSVYYVSNTKLGESSYVKPRFYYDKFDNTLQAFDDATYTTQKKGSSFTSIYDDYTWGSSVEIGTEWLPYQTLKGAFHYKLDHHDEHNVGAPYYQFEDQTFDFAVEDNIRLGERWSVVPGASYEFRDVLQAVDTNTGKPLSADRFDSLNPQIGAFYEQPGWGTFHATVARKSRFPTIKDRYSYRLGQAIPNPNLEPERANHFELGYRGTLATNLTFTTAVFYSRIEDSIQRVDNVATSAAGASLFQLQNVGTSENIGTELGLEYGWLESVKLGGNYTYLSRENVTTPSIRPTDTPRNKVFGWVEFIPVEWVSFIPSLEWEDQRYSTSYGIVAGSYFLLDLKLSLRLGGGLTVNGGVQNVLDRNYALVEGFPEPGRTFFANLTYHF